jgi:hypothetical protein
MWCYFIWRISLRGANMIVRSDKTIKIELQEGEANRLIKLLKNSEILEIHDGMCKFRTDLLGYLIIACK